MDGPAPSGAARTEDAQTTVGAGGPSKVASDYCSGQRATGYKRDGWAIFGRAARLHGAKLADCG